MRLEDPAGERRRAVAARDAQILAQAGADPELTGLDKARPVLVLTRELVRPHMTTVTVAPITTTVRGLSTELAIYAANGLAEPSVVSCDNITTIPASSLGEQIGRASCLPARGDPALPSRFQAASNGWQVTLDMYGM